MGKSVISQDYMEKVVEIRPDSPLFARYTHNLLMEKRLSQARGISEYGISQLPNFATGRFVLALCLIEQKDYDAAKEQLFELLKIEPTHSAALAKLAQIFSASGDVEQSHKITDFLVRLNPKSHFLKKVPHRNSGNDTIYEILGSELEWKDFASESYLKDKEEIEAQRIANTDEKKFGFTMNIPVTPDNSNELSLEEQIQNEFIEEKADEIVADVEANTHTLSLEDTGKQIDEIFAQIESGEVTIDEQEENPNEIKPDFSNVSEICNSETLSNNAETPEDLSAKADEIVADVEANTHTLSLEDTGKQIDEIFAQIESGEVTIDEQEENPNEIKPDFGNVSEICNSETLAENVEPAEPKEISFEEQLENEISEAISEKDFADEIGGDIMAELENQNASPVLEETPVIDDDFAASIFGNVFDGEATITPVETEKNDEFTDFKNSIEESIDALPLDNPPLPPKKEETISPKIFETTEFSMDDIQTLMTKTKEEDKKPDEIMAQTFDSAFENYRNEKIKVIVPKEPTNFGETSEYTASILENTQQKLSVEEQKAEPISEKEAFADMLAKNESGADLLPDHILTPTFAQIYLEQGQPFLAKQIYERLLTQDGENDEYTEKLKEVNNIIEKMKSGEIIEVKPKENAKRKTPKTEKIPVVTHKSLKGKRIKQEIRDTFREKHSTTKESVEKK